MRFGIGAKLGWDLVTAQDKARNLYFHTAVCAKTLALNLLLLLNIIYWTTCKMNNKCCFSITEYGCSSCWYFQALDHWGTDKLCFNCQQWGDKTMTQHEQQSWGQSCIVLWWWMCESGLSQPWPHTGRLSKQANKLAEIQLEAGSTFTS